MYEKREDKNGGQKSCPVEHTSAAHTEDTWIPLTLGGTKRTKRTQGKLKTIVELRWLLVGLFTSSNQDYEVAPLITPKRTKLLQQ